jgi:probable H4MPT-linked C1 transfer pathway protein
MQNLIIGWDIGGAHLKAALLSAGQLKQVVQVPCPLWQGVAFLQEAVEHVVQAFKLGDVICDCQHAITMTGELVDCFADRNEGVREIIGVMQNILQTPSLFFYAGHSGFLSIDQIKPEHSLQIASANWLASSEWIAAQGRDALFVDIGSTTTDVILIHNQRPDVQGMTDYERLLTEEMVYTGVIRTPLMAVSRYALFKGQKVPVMAEYFATMADVYRLTGELNEAHDQTSSCDGQEKTPQASARRLSRMIGCDYQLQDQVFWQRMALGFRHRQLQQIETAVLRQLSRHSTCLPVLIGAGVGRFLAKDLAHNLSLVYCDFNEQVGSTSADVITAADCAPASSVALLFHSRSLI